MDLNVWQPEFSEEGYRDGVISISPSDLETHSAIAAEEEQQDHRPSGNLFGTVMHRAMELLIPGIRAGSPACNIAISQALLENAEILRSAFGDEFDQTVIDYRDYLQKVLTTLAENTAMGEAIRNAREVATEYPFWLYASEADSSDLFQDLRETLTPKQQERYLPETPDRKVWITGKADLVLFEQDGSITIWDYKSDLNHGLSKEEFAGVIEKRYGTQMLLYRHVFAKLFKLPIEKVHGQFYTIS